jgi:intracellular sulfur oxidation DsrE/DsrF family protein
MINMKKTTSLCFILCFLISASYAQHADKEDSVQKAKKDSIRIANLMSQAVFPLIKNSENSGVIPVKDIQEMPDPSLKFKLLFNFTAWVNDSSARKKIDWGLAEIGRIINLHIAAGVPKENLDIVLVIHGASLNTLLTNENYRKKFNVDNPNLDVLKQLTVLNAKLIACSQAELYFNIPREQMISEVRNALSAQVVMSNYQLKGFVLYKISDEQ